MPAAARRTARIGPSSATSASATRPPSSSDSVTRGPPAVLIFMIRAGLLACLLAPLPQEAADLKPGLLGEFFELQGEVEDFPALAADKKPALRRIDSLINFDTTEAAFGGTTLTDKFFVRWTGILRVAVEGKFTFYTESDDGSRFYVGDTKVVDNGGL